MTDPGAAPIAVATVITARWIVPVQPAGVTLTDYAVVVDDGVIVAVAPVAEVDARYRPAERVDLANHVLIPGLVNAHTHTPMTLLRGFADDLPLMTWLHDHIWPAEAAWVSPQFVADGTELAIAEMLRSGTTCLSDMYFYPEHGATVAQDHGMRMVVGLICLDAPTGYAADAPAYLRKAAQVHGEVADLPLVTTALAPHAPYTLSDGPWRELVELAADLDVPIHTHLHETSGEVADSLRDHGLRPIERMAQLGVLDQRLIAAHMTQATASDIELLAASGTSIAHCPESNLKLASGFAPVAKFQAAGVNVAIGTDGAASNNDLDMLAELRLSALLAKAAAGDARAVPAHTALRMATLAGAQALGLEHVIGSIEVGKQADLTAFSFSSLASVPLYDPVSQLVYATTRDQVSDVWVAGERQVRDGELTGLDVGRLRAMAQQWAQRISG